jgi:hypothetical protein
MAEEVENNMTLLGTVDLKIGKNFVVDEINKMKDAMKKVKQMFSKKDKSIFDEVFGKDLDLKEIGFSKKDKNIFDEVFGKDLDLKKILDEDFGKDLDLKKTFDEVFGKGLDLKEFGAKLQEEFSKKDKSIFDEFYGKDLDLKEIMELFQEEDKKKPAKKGLIQQTKDTMSQIGVTKIFAGIKTLVKTTTSMLGFVSIGALIFEILKPITNLVGGIFKILGEFLRPIADVLTILFQPILVMIRPILQMFKVLMQPFKELSMKGLAAANVLIAQGMQIGGETGTAMVKEGWGAALSSAKLLLSGFTEVTLSPLIESLDKIGLFSGILENFTNWIHTAQSTATEGIVRGITLSDTFLDLIPVLNDTESAAKSALGAIDGQMQILKENTDNWNIDNASQILEDAKELASATTGAIGLVNTSMTGENDGLTKHLDTLQSKLNETGTRIEEFNAMIGITEVPEETEAKYKEAGIDYNATRQKYEIELNRLNKDVENMWKNIGDSPGKTKQILSEYGDFFKNPFGYSKEKLTGTYENSAVSEYLSQVDEINQYKFSAQKELKEKYAELFDGNILKDVTIDPEIQETYNDKINEIKKLDKVYINQMNESKTDIINASKTTITGINTGVQNYFSEEPSVKIDNYYAKIDDMILNRVKSKTEDYFAKINTTMSTNMDTINTTMKTKMNIMQSYINSLTVPRSVVFR